MNFLQGIDQDFNPELLSKIKHSHIKHSQKKAKINSINIAVKKWLDTVHPEHKRFSIESKEFLDKVKALTDPVGVENLNDFFIEPEGFLILQGDTGLAKTSLAVAIGTNFVQEGIVSDAELILNTLMLDSFSQYNAFSKETQINPVDHFSNIDLLVIDDVGIGNERITPVQEQRLSTVIDNRWGNGKITIMTTNMAIHGKSGSGIGMSNYFTKATWNRITDKVSVVQFKGDSLRD